MRSRYTYGVVEMSHKGKKVTTNVGTEFDDLVEKVDDVAFKQSYLLPNHEARPDLLSDTFYDNPGQWWYVMHINNISDPIQEMVTSKRIKLPDVR